jgi:cysteinyl-tRNA synthetase
MTPLKIYNTLAREKQLFTPIVPGQVRMYVCGMTIYDYCHIGHGRMMLAFDVVYRWLRASGYSVTYVRNITDIDDKIIRRAVENDEPIASLTRRFIDAMAEDTAALGILPPTEEPRATRYVPQMLDMISRLQSKGLAYQGDDGDVNYSVRDFPGYGKLSGKSLDDLRAGERVDVNTGKRDPLDFVLWKAAKEGEPEDAKWSSPWGVGRPGWHIECSAMACALLGEQFDIHGGGTDLQFPHHENEIAQAEGASDKPFANYWLHNGHVRIDNEKMSKSLDNFFLIRDVLVKYDAEVLRFFILRAHYRSPLNYSDTHLDDARVALTRLYKALNDVVPSLAGLDWSLPYPRRFAEAMDDDFNTPLALAVLFDLTTEINRSGDAGLAGQLRSLAAVLGLLERNPQQFLQSAHGTMVSDGDNAQIAEKIAARIAAKLARDYATADRLRDELVAAGILLEDKPGNITEWRRA